MWKLKDEFTQAGSNINRDNLNICDKTHGIVYFLYGEKQMDIPNI